MANPIRFRKWDPVWGKHPTCPSCKSIVDIEIWEAGTTTCQRTECIRYYTEDVLPLGFEWNGYKWVISNPQEEREVRIERETKPDGTIILSKHNDSSSISPEVIQKDKMPDNSKNFGRSGGKVYTAENTGFAAKHSPSQTRAKEPAVVYKPIVDLARRQVFIAPQAMFDINFLVRSCPFEISGFGLVDTLEEGLLIKSIHLLKQNGGGTHTEIDPVAIAELMMEIDARNEDTGKLRFWWHSHPGSSGNPSPSGTDINTFSSFGRGAKGIAPDWFINAIFNPGGGQYWRFDMYRPIRTAIEISPCHWHPSFGSTNWKEEMETKITKASDTVQSVTRSNWSENFTGAHDWWPFSE